MLERKTVVPVRTFPKDQDFEGKFQHPHNGGETTRQFIDHLWSESSLRGMGEARYSNALTSITLF